MERISPAPKDKSVSFPLPDMKDSMDACKAASSVLKNHLDCLKIDGGSRCELGETYHRQKSIMEYRYRYPDSVTKK